MKNLTLTAITLAFLGVILGAFGAHALKTMVEPYALNTWETGVRYQMIHALAMLILAAFGNQVQATWQKYAGICFAIGIVLFSGSLYVIVLSKISNLGIITPIGGIFMLGGWLCFFMGYLTHHEKSRHDKPNKRTS